MPINPKQIVIVHIMTLHAYKIRNIAIIHIMALHVYNTKQIAKAIHIMGPNAY